MMTTVQLVSLSFGYGRPLFTNVTASVIPGGHTPKGGVVSVVMGASGCGKTTLLKLILGEERPSSGRIEIEPRNSRVSYLSQEPVLFEHLSIQANARYFSGIRSTRHHFDEAVYQRASADLSLAEILRRSSSIAQLSGGERQRIALLRALSIRPALLLLDEPCRGLDIPVRQEFMSHLRTLADELGVAVVYVTHQQDEARFLADRIIFLVRDNAGGGTRIIQGALSDVITTPRHESIATTFSDWPMNRAPAVLDGAKLVLFGKTYRCKLGARYDEGSSTRGLLLFGATSVRWNQNGGIACGRSSRTGQFEVATVKAEPSAIVVGPQTDDEITSVDVCGEGLLFSENGHLIAKIAIAGS